MPVRPNRGYRASPPARQELSSRLCRDGRLLDVRGTDLGSAFEEVAYVGPGATRPATAANRPGGRRLRELLAEGG